MYLSAEPVCVIGLRSRWCYSTAQPALLCQEAGNRRARLQSLVTGEMWNESCGERSMFNPGSLALDIVEGRWRNSSRGYDNELHTS